MSVERSITMRKGVAADAAGIARVHVDSWRSTYRGLVPDGYLQSLSLAEERPGSIVGSSNTSAGASGGRSCATWHGD